MISYLTALRWRWLALVLGVGVAGVVALTALTQLRRPRPSAAQRGQALAAKLGCFGCHGVDGAGGVPNPGAAEGEVPPLRATSTLPSYVQSDAELAEWVRDGRPARLAAARAPATGETPLLRMPGYGRHLKPGELSELVSYLRAIGGYQPPGEAAVAAGREVARSLGCFGGHGQDGRGALPNPGSLNGIIPAWDSDDYLRLVANEAELRQWILDGTIPRLRDSKVARFFFERQAIHMPSYRARISEQELTQLVDFVRWVRRPTNLPGRRAPSSTGAPKS